MIQITRTVAFIKATALFTDDELDDLADGPRAVTWGDAQYTLVRGDHPMFDDVRAADSEYDAELRECTARGILIDLEA